MTSTDAIFARLYSAGFLASEQPRSPSSRLSDMSEHAGMILLYRRQELKQQMIQFLCSTDQDIINTAIE